MYNTDSRHVRFAALTRLFVLLYMFVCGTICLHQQELHLMKYRAASAAVTLSVTTPSTPTLYRVPTQQTFNSVRECQVCKLVADIVARIPTPRTYRHPVFVAYRAVLLPNPKPFLPYRFYDRSSSRAPPIA